MLYGCLPSSVLANDGSVRIPFALQESWVSSCRRRSAPFDHLVTNKGATREADPAWLVVAFRGGDENPPLAIFASNPEQGSPGRVLHLGGPTAGPGVDDVEELIPARDPSGDPPVPVPHLTGSQDEASP